MLGIEDINFLEKDYPQLRGQRNRLLNQNKDLYKQVQFQALIIKEMALELRNNFASDVDINKVIKYYEKVVSNQILKESVKNETHNEI